MSDDYIQHNADTADGKDGFIKFAAYIFRLQDGKLAEYWDVIEYDIGDVQSKSGRDMFE